MRKRLIYILLFSLLIASGIAHIWEYRKIQEFSENFAIQGEIETKRTALMVLYQEVLQGMAKEVDTLRANEKMQPLELNFEGESK